MLYVTEAAPDCAYALAEVGSTPGSGGRLYVRDTIPSVMAHELGHNFGLGHSSGLQCDAVVETGDCGTSAYRDLYDVMGVSGKARLAQRRAGGPPGRAPGRSGAVAVGAEPQQHRHPGAARRPHRHPRGAADRRGRRRLLA